MLMLTRERACGHQNEHIGDIGLSRRSFIALALNYFILLSTKIVWWLSTRLNVNRGSGLYIEWV